MADKELGKWGEDTVAEYMRRSGYRILEKNFRTRMGEIDIIAADRNCVAFVEVKTRRDASYACAREYVTYSKQKKVRAAALYWLSGHRCALQPRFDVAEVYPGPDGQPIINILENAFE